MSKSEKLPPKVGHILRLAEIIRNVDGSHKLGAAALAEAILSHPDWPLVAPIDALKPLLTDDELVERATCALDRYELGSELAYFLHEWSDEYEPLMLMLRAVAQKAEGGQE